MQVAAITYMIDQNEPSRPFILELPEEPQAMREALLKTYVELCADADEWDATLPLRIEEDNSPFCYGDLSVMDEDGDLILYVVFSAEHHHLAKEVACDKCFIELPKETQETVLKGLEEAKAGNLVDGPDVSQDA